MIMSAVAVLGFTILAVVGSWGYFRHLRVRRPPFGVMNLGDVAFAGAVIIVFPYLYLAASEQVLGALLALITLSVLHATLEPIIQGRRLWAVCLSLLTLDIGVSMTAGTTSLVFVLVNDSIVVITIIGLANMWAQGGIRAGHLVVFAAWLAVYDAIATWKLPLMLELFIRLAPLPFTPLVSWGTADEQTTLLLGVGDILLASLFPLVLRKAFGRAAGVIAAIVCLITIAVILVLQTAEAVPQTIPVMVFLGPLMVAQYLYWRHACGSERSTKQYLQAEPLSPHDPTIQTLGRR